MLPLDSAVDHGDPYDLNRFIKAQEGVYDRALAELRAGDSRSDWMWYLFPQIEGLGHSPTTRHYSIKSLKEARQYLVHPVLGARLVAHGLGGAIVTWEDLRGGTSDVYAQGISANGRQ